MIGKTDTTGSSNRVHASHPAEGPLLTLEISRGRTQFRRRPVWDKRYLIGGGKRCHLRLGGDAMPTLHSILLVEEQDIWLDAVADTPPLFVNGEIERSVRLADGDAIRIGTFEFTIRRNPSTVSPKPHFSRDADNICSPDEVAAADPANLSATDLVALLEQDIELVEEFEASRRLGASALLSAIRDRAELPRIAGRISAPAETPVVLQTPAPNPRVAAPAVPAVVEIGKELLDELDDVVRRLNHCSEELDRRAERLSPRELNYSEAAKALVEAQKALDAQLERVLARLAPLESGRSEPMRASA